jgi:hypothetical protein
MNWDGMSALYTMTDKQTFKGSNTMKTTKSMIESYNQAIQRPLFIDQAHKASVWLDVLIAVSVGLMLCIGALAYFDVLTK